MEAKPHSPPKVDTSIEALVEDVGTSLTEPESASPRLFSIRHAIKIVSPGADDGRSPKSQIPVIKTPKQWQDTEAEHAHFQREQSGLKALSRYVPRKSELEFTNMETLDERIENNILKSLKFSDDSASSSPTAFRRSLRETSPSIRETDHEVRQLRREVRRLSELADSLVLRSDDQNSCLESCMTVAETLAEELLLLKQPPTLSQDVSKSRERDRDPRGFAVELTNTASGRYELESVYRDIVS